MTIVDVAQVVGAFGGLAGFSALAMEIRWRKLRRKAPPVDLVIELQRLEEVFGDILANGGQRGPWFLEPERRRQIAHLAMLNGQVVDDNLNRLVGKARMSYEDSFSASPTGHEERQIQFAETGRATCVKAIDRANELLRKYSQ